MSEPTNDDRRDAASWQASRRDVVAEQAAALARRKLAESTAARGILAAFVTEMAASDEPPIALRARSGRATYATGLTGWYLKADQSLAVDESGEFYVLRIPSPGLLARVTGVTLAPTEPALAVGVGARDGESMTLVELLERRMQRKG